MGSENREIREKQMERARARLDGRIAELEKAGREESAIRKDPAVRALEAKVREARSRLAAMDAAASWVSEVAAKKSAKPAKKGGGPKKGKGAGADEAGGGKGKGKGKAEGGGAKKGK